MKYWFDRRSGQWNSFDANRKWSYYKFLRAVYGMTASEAWFIVNNSKDLGI